MLHHSTSTSQSAARLRRALRLVWITDQRLSAERTIECARAALEGGVTSVQLRRHDMTAAELFALATQLRRLTTETDAFLIVNDRVDVALAAEADGVHLGRHSLPIFKARVLSGGDLVIGFSAHSEAEIAHAAIAGADYCSLSPILPPISKASGRPELGIPGLARAASRSVLPIVALGGLTEQSAPAIIAAGAVGIATSGAISDAESPRDVAAGLLKLVGG
jgi:thiamine-phosphate pyrophosphorylase